MPKALVLEPNSVSAAMLEDRLHVAGYRVVTLDSAARAAERAVEEHAEVIVLAVDLPGTPGLDLVRELRQRPETRSTPIVALSAGTESAERLAILRAGADEVLQRPFEVEELLLRVERLLGSRGLMPPLMQGDLTNHPPWEVAQYVQNGAKSGELSISGRDGAGKVQLLRGKVLSARYRHLEGREALLAMLSLKEGRFRLADEESDGQPPDDAISLHGVLMEAAWIEDELTKRRAHLPATGAPLESLAERPPELDSGLASLPLARLLDEVRERPGVRLYDLMSHAPEAPLKVRLTVAVLAEAGVLAPRRPSGDAPVMSTLEISSSVLLEMAVDKLLESARDAGLDPSALSYLLLVEPGVFDDLRGLLESVPGAHGIEALRKLNQTLKLRRGGSATFSVETGTLSLHVQMLTADVRSRAEAIVSVCAGVLLWLDRAEEREAIEQVVRRLESSSEAAVGVMVAHTPEAREVADELASSSRRWQVSPMAPRALVGVLRLLHPRPEA